MSVELIKIARALGEYTDLATCCQSNNINKWSFYKPINNESLLAISDSDWYAVNDGFNLFTFNQPQRLLYELTHPNASTIWTYTDREEPFRLTDFESYNHYANPIFPLSFDGNNSGTAGTSLRMSCPGFNDFIQRWAYFSGVRNWVDICLLIYEPSTEYDQSGTQGVYIYKFVSMVDYDGNEQFSFRIPNNLTAGKQYIARICCTTATTGWSDGECQYYNPNSQILSGNWYAFPEHSRVYFSVDQSGGGGGGSTDLFNYLAFSFAQGSWDYNDNTMQLSNIHFVNVVSISGTHNYITVQLEYRYRGGGLNVLLGTAGRTLSEEDIPWVTANINYAGPINVTTASDLENKLPVHIKATATMNNVTQVKEWDHMFLVGD